MKKLIGILWVTGLSVMTLFGIGFEEPRSMVHGVMRIQGIIGNYPMINREHKGDYNGTERQ